MAKKSPPLRLHELQDSAQIAQIFINRMVERNYGYITVDNRLFLIWEACNRSYNKGGLGIKKHETMKTIQAYFNNIVKSEDLKANPQYRTLNGLTWKLFGSVLEEIRYHELFDGLSFKPRTINITPPVELNKFTTLTDAMNFLVEHQDIRKNDTIVVVGILMSMLMVKEWDTFSGIICKESLRPVIVLQKTSEKCANAVADIVNLKVRELEESYKQLSKNVKEFNKVDTNTTIKVIEAENLLRDYEQGIFAGHYRSVGTAPQFSCHDLEKVRLHLYRNSALSEGIREKLSRYLNPLGTKEDVPLR